METISITLPHDIREKLKEVPNVSGLIAKLLRDFFIDKGSPEVLKRKKEELIKEMNHKMAQIDCEIENGEKKLEDKEKEEIDRKREEKEADERWENTKFSHITKNGKEYN